MNLDEKYKFFHELGFFTLSNAAPTLGKFLKDTITISSPKTDFTKLSDFKNGFKESVYTTIVFNGGKVGETHVIMNKVDAMKLARYVIKQRFGSERHVADWDEFSINAIEEVMNILGGNMTEILAVVFGFGIDIDVPELKFSVDEFNLYSDDEEFVMNTYTVYLGTEEKIKIKELAKESYYKELVNQLKNRV